jgi:hypothetical protein
MECVEKEKFAFDKVDGSLATTLETDSKYDRDACAYTAKRVMRKK